VKDKSYYNETVLFMLETTDGTLKIDLSILNLMFS